VIYESPFRIKQLVNEVVDILGDRKCCLINDITKVFEKISRDTLLNLQKSLENSKFKGEFVLVIGKEGF
jgi:16S rRNA (cytidine1402-2'-O)-methyltransferase